ncbi:hypothetical protein D3C85_1417180 [compost metagenome]
MINRGIDFAMSHELNAKLVLQKVYQFLLGISSINRDKIGNKVMIAEFFPLSQRMCICAHKNLIN